MEDDLDPDSQSSVDKRTPEQEGDEGPPFVYPEPIESPEEFARDISERLVAMSSSWQGRLPRPEYLRQFDEVVPGLAREIADDMLEDGHRIDRAMAIDHELSTRVLDRIDRESDADITFRQYVFNRILPALYIPFILVSLTLFAPVGDSAKIAIVFFVLLASIAPLCIALLRGRMGKTEAEVIKSAVPEIVAAVRGSARVADGNSSDDVPDPIIRSGDAS